VDRLRQGAIGCILAVLPPAASGQNFLEVLISTIAARIRNGLFTLAWRRRALTIALAAPASACAHMQFRSPITSVEGPPAAFVATTSDVRLTRVIDVRDDVAKPAAFTAAEELLKQHYSIDVEDQRAGFLMTPWQASLNRNGAPDLRYRTRVVIRFLGQDWKQVSVRAEANWQRGDEWDTGYDTRLLDDVIAELRTKIGKT
jgi:hypothetical protein